MKPATGGEALKPVRLPTARSCEGRKANSSERYSPPKAKPIGPAGRLKNFSVSPLIVAPAMISSKSDDRCA